LCFCICEPLILIVNSQSEISDLHKALAEQQAAAQSNAAKLERSTLQLDGERTKNAELQRHYDELRRTNQDLSRQLDKWQSLETKGGEEVEALRKQKVDLEIQLQALQNQLKKREEDHARHLEREKQKIQKLKANVDHWSVRLQSLI
jgi:predicted  nucleic acid-binding Zn-ribbon protein